MILNGIEIYVFKIQLEIYDFEFYKNFIENI